MKLFYIFIYFAVLALLSCSGSEPVIDEIDWRLINRDDGKFRHEEILLFMRVSDPDDESDPNEVLITAKDTGYQWRFIREQWISMNIHDVQWWGMPSMIPLTGSKMPDALYLVTLYDLAGRRAESTFRPDPGRPDINSIQWPKAEIRNNRLRLENVQGSPRLILKNSAMEFYQDSEAVDGMLIDSSAAWWELWINLGDSGSGLRLGPYSVATGPGRSETAEQP